MESDDVVIVVTNALTIAATWFVHLHVLLLCTGPVRRAELLGCTRTLMRVRVPAFTCTHTFSTGRLILALWSLGWPALDSTAQISLSRSPHIRSPLCTSLHLIHLVIAAKFLPSLQHRLPPRWPLQLSAAYNLLITLHPSTPVSEHCAFPQFTPIFFLKLPLFTPYCLLTHFIILNLASISLSLPHPWKVQESSFWLFSLSPHC